MKNFIRYTSDTDWAIRVRPANGDIALAAILFVLALGVFVNVLLGAAAAVKNSPAELGTFSWVCAAVFVTAAVLGVIVAGRNLTRTAITRTIRSTDPIWEGAAAKRFDGGDAIYRAHTLGRLPGGTESFARHSKLDLARKTYLLIAADVALLRAEADHHAAIARGRDNRHIRGSRMKAAAAATSARVSYELAFNHASRAAHVSAATHRSVFDA